MNIEAVAQRALDLHEKTLMPLSQAVELALSEAAPGPIWPCAKLIIRDGKVAAESHQYAPGLPDGEHDVYPLPVDADAAPTGAPGAMEALRNLTNAFHEGRAGAMQREAQGYIDGLVCAAEQALAAGVIEEGE